MKFKELEEQWSPLIHKFSTKYPIPGYDIDDIKQELRLTLWRANKLYDPNRGTKFITYLYSAFDSKLKLLYRNVQGRNKHIPNEMISYISDETHKQPYEVPEYNSLDFLVGLNYPARQLGEMILAGKDTKQEWLKLGMTENEIEEGKRELQSALQV